MFPGMDDDLIARLGPIVTGDGSREERAAPAADLVRARTAGCCAPGCGAQAITSEIDHTTPYPAGPTCEGNLGPLCKRQARPRLETPAAPARHHALDHPLRPHLHHPPHPIRGVTRLVSRP